MQSRIPACPGIGGLMSLVLDSRELDILQRAYDQACRSLRGQTGAEPDKKTKRMLALRIVESATLGERDLQKLKAEALGNVMLVDSGLLHSMTSSVGARRLLVIE
jgi:hypothetical protein